METQAISWDSPTFSDAPHSKSSISHLKTWLRDNVQAYLYEEIPSPNYLTNIFLKNNNAQDFNDITGVSQCRISSVNTVSAIKCYAPLYRSRRDDA